MRFDGVHFRAFEKDAPAELQEKIKGLVRDNGDGVWVATVNGVFHYSHNRFNAVAIPGDSHAPIQILARASDGGVWVVLDSKLMRDPRR